MKLALGTLCLVLSIFSLASFAATNGCDVVKCGSYVEAPGDDGIGLTINFLATEAANKVSFAWIYTKDGVDTGRGVKLTLVFADDGSFSAFEGDKLYASGACGNSACTYGMTPAMVKEKLLLQTGTFKFNGDTLEAAIYSPNSDGDDFVSKGVLNKQN